MPPGNFEVLHALKCVLGASEAPFCACIQSIHTCKLPSSFSSFRSKTMTYRALASGPRSSYIRQKCALKFVSEQHKCKTG